MPLSVFFAAVMAAAFLGGLVVWLWSARRRGDPETARLAAFLDHGPFMAFMKDADGRYVFENRAVVEHVGRVRPGVQTLLGRRDHEVFGKAEEEAYVDNDRRVIESGRPMRFDEISVDADGTIRNWSTVKFPWVDARGRRCPAGISLDVSALQQARSEARSHEDQYRLALDAGRMGTFSLDLASQMLDTSPLFAILHGRPETKTRIGLQESLAEVHPDDHAMIAAAVQAALADRAPSRIAYRVVLPDARVRWLELVGHVFGDSKGRPIGVRGVGFDVTDARSGYEELTHRTQTLRRLIEVQENERQTLCHELHDGLIQYAIGATMQLEAARDEDDTEARGERIAAAIDCLKRGIEEGRQVIRGVRPAVLDDLGLTAAIEDLADQMAAADVAVKLSLDGGIDALPSPLATTVYRVVQESLTNVRKHAATDRATVEIRRATDGVDVRVRDHGAGFDVDEGRKRGFGLVAMMERVRLAGGRLWIESQPGHGSQVNVHLPVVGSGGDEADADGGAERAAMAHEQPS